MNLAKKYRCYRIQRTVDNNVTTRHITEICDNNGVQMLVNSDNCEILMVHFKLFKNKNHLLDLETILDEADQKKRMGVKQDRYGPRKEHHPQIEERPTTRGHSNSDVGNMMLVDIKQESDNESLIHQDDFQNQLIEKMRKKKKKKDKSSKKKSKKKDKKGSKVAFKEGIEIKEILQNE